MKSEPGALSYLIGKQLLIILIHIVCSVVKSVLGMLKLQSSELQGLMVLFEEAKSTPRCTFLYKKNISNH